MVNSKNASSGEKGIPKSRYFRIKITSLDHISKVRQIMQIIDITSCILYDKEHAQNSFLSLINACVSHELRNPLNSIMAQNIEKVNLYKELTKNIEFMDHSTKEYLECQRILNDLNNGLKVQDSSANIMSFMVQDLLDYAQIKANKFRKVLNTFNIRESVERVMCIQRQKAQE